MSRLSKEIEENLIKDYGDQAYHKGIHELTIGTIIGMNKKYLGHIAKAVQSLMQKGYHKHKKNDNQETSKNIKRT